MLYIKTKLKGGEVIRAGIHDDNTYAVCSKCGKEVPVHLNEVFSSDATAPLTANIVCPECTKKHVSPKTPTLADILLLATALCGLDFLTCGDENQHGGLQHGR